MIRAFAALIFLLLLVPVDLSFAQGNPGGTKVYSGYLHQQSVKHKVSFWHALFGKTTSRQEEVLYDRQCSIEFKSPVPFSHQAVSVVPEQLTYLIKFKDGMEPFKKFLIKIYTTDEEEYSIDPDSEGKQVGIDQEHHIFDSYLVYLILGTDIDHLEVVSASADDQGRRYVLDKLEVRNDN